MNEMRSYAHGLTDEELVQELQEREMAFERSWSEPDVGVTTASHSRRQLVKTWLIFLKKSHSESGGVRQVLRE